MPIVPADLKLYLPSVVGTSLTAPVDVGGAKSNTPITGGSIGELLFAMASNSLGGADKVQYQKFFLANDHATLDLSDAVVWLHNSLDVSAGGYVTTAKSSSASDGSNRYLRVIGNDASADAQEEFALAGTVLASGTIQFADRWVVTLHDSETDALAPAVGTIEIRENGVLLGIIPPGAYSCTGEIRLGLASGLNDTDTADDAGTAPSGISFSRPRTPASGIEVANSGVLSHEAAQGCWLEWTVHDGRRASGDIEVYPLIEGVTS